jgi:hypothetical protein
VQTEVIIDENIDVIHDMYGSSKTYPNGVDKPPVFIKRTTNYKPLLHIKASIQREPAVWRLPWHHVGTFQKVPTYPSASIVPYVIPTDALTKAKARAFAQVLPSVESFVETVNLWSIVGELKEVRRLIPDIIGALRGKHNNAFDNLADGWLVANFAAIPFASDIIKIFNIFSKLDDAINRWNDFAEKGKPMSFHSTVYDIDETRPVQNETVNSGSNWSVTETVTGEAQIKAKSIVSLYVQPQVIPVSDRSTIWAKAFGLNNFASGAWELIPFSWLIDYFVNVGDFVSRLDHSIDSLFKFHFIDSGISYKEHSISDLILVQRTIYNGCTTDNNVLSSSQKADMYSYTRVPMELSEILDGISEPALGI